MAGATTAPRPGIVTAGVLVIGNEILSGRTQDQNIAFLGRALGEIGIQHRESRVVPDDEAAIVEALNALRGRYTYVFTTGGIGPTHDDITAAAVARAFDRPLVRHPEAEARLRAQYAQSGREVTPARLKMAEMPAGAALVDNTVSVAPGFLIENVCVMAGIPAVAQAMFEAIKGRLAGGAVMVAREVSCNLPEGVVAAGLARIQAAYSDVEIGSYPRYETNRGPVVTLVLRATVPARVDAAAHDVVALVGELGGTVLPPTAPETT